MARSLLPAGLLLAAAYGLRSGAAAATAAATAGDPAPSHPTARTLPMPAICTNKVHIIPRIIKCQDRTGVSIRIAVSIPQPGHYVLFCDHHHQCDVVSSFPGDPKIEPNSWNCASESAKSSHSQVPPDRSTSMQPTSSISPFSSKQLCTCRQLFNYECNR